MTSTEVVAQTPEQLAESPMAAAQFSTGAPGPSAPPQKLNIHADGYQMIKAKEYVALWRATGKHPDKHSAPIGGWLYNYSRGMAGKGPMKPRDDVTAYLGAELGEFWETLVARARVPHADNQLAKSERLTRGLIEHYELHGVVAPHTGATKDMNKLWHAMVGIETREIVNAHSGAAPKYSGTHKASIALIKDSVMKQRFAAAAETQRRKIRGQPVELPAPIV